MKDKNKTIDVLVHSYSRMHIPSQEEAGTESASPKVKDGKKILEIPKNPVVNRGQDPELFWLNKYGNDDRDNLLKIDIRSLYRYEHIAPEQIINGLYKMVENKKNKQDDLFSINESFGNALEYDELEKVSQYYTHEDGWSNRLIQGDSLLSMTSLLERENMAGTVQCMYFDPPYGIKYNSNWQMKLNDRNVKDGSDEHLTGEPEMIKAFRDTWELGIHSYLSYLRDRLLVAKELLTDSGSCFVQISDENVHLVRNIMDEVFGSENFVSLITYTTSVALGGTFLQGVCNYILFYAKDKTKLKFRKQFVEKNIGEGAYSSLMLPDGSWRSMTKDETLGKVDMPKGSKPFFNMNLLSAGRTESCVFPVEINGKKILPGGGKSWKTNKQGMDKLIKKGRVIHTDNNIRYVLFHEDFPVRELTDNWNDLGGAVDKMYVVQTNLKVIQRCILMTTDPGDLVLDPTCGSGTTAYVAEQWGRRWITIDTSRIALNIAKSRLLTATFPYYKLYDEKGKDIRQGFIYKKVPHVTLKSLANDEPPEEETLYDKPEPDNKKLRVAGSFIVETLQNFEPVSPESLEDGTIRNEDSATFENRIFEHLKSSGVKNGIKNEQAVFIRIERLTDAYLHAEGFYNTPSGERKAYFHIGPKFGTVAKQAVNESMKACRQRGDADWLIILGFSFESTIENQNVTMSAGSFEVTRVRMNDDLMQDGLLKKDKKAASFVTIGEPDIALNKNGNEAQVEIKGLDLYDPIKDEVKARNVEDLAYWMVDTDYDGNNFVVRQVFFCGGSKDEFDAWKKGLSSLASDKTKKDAERLLKIEIDDEAFARLYGFISHPFVVKKGQKVAVRVISQYGEESTKVLIVG